MAAPLGDLLSRSWNRFRAKWRVLLLGVACVTALMILAQMVIGQRSGLAAFGALRSILGEQRVEQIAAELNQGGDIQAVARRVGNEVSLKLKSMTDEQRSALFSTTLSQVSIMLLPVLSIFVPLLIILFIWARAFFIATAVMPDPTSFKDAVSRATQTFFPILAIRILIILKSFAWLPLIIAPLIFFHIGFVLLFLAACVPMIIFLPRYALSEVLYMRHGGITSSVRESYAKTNGYWAKIVGNLIVMALLVSLAVGVLQWGVDILSQLVGALSLVIIVLYWARSIARIIGSAYRTVFLVELTDEIVRGPIITA